MALPTRTFHIHNLLGEGGFGKVYRATLSTPVSSAEVAIKFVTSDDVHDLVLARLKDEARILGLIDHPTAVRPFLPATFEGRPAVVMEFVDGESTARMLSRRKAVLPARVATAVVLEVARCLLDLQEQRGPGGRPLAVLHRDIKPGNIQVTRSGSVRLLDFGVARVDMSYRHAETTVHAMGTPRYMAPERRSGLDTPAGDIYSLGCTWRRLMTGDRPTGDGGFVTARKRPPPTRMLEEGEAFIARMVAPDPEARPTWSEVVEVLASLEARMAGPSLAAWATSEVSPAVGEAARLTGCTLVEDPRDPTPIPGTYASESSVLERIGEPPRPSPARSLLATGVLFAIPAVIACGVAVLGLGLGAYQVQRAADSLRTAQGAQIQHTVAIGSASAPVEGARRMSRDVANAAGVWGEVSQSPLGQAACALGLAECPG